MRASYDPYPHMARVGRAVILRERSERGIYYPLVIALRVL